MMLGLERSTKHLGCLLLQLTAPISSSVLPALKAAPNLATYAPRMIAATASSSSSSSSLHNTGWPILSTYLRPFTSLLSTHRLCWNSNTYNGGSKHLLYYSSSSTAMTKSASVFSSLLSGNSRAKNSINSKNLLYYSSSSSTTATKPAHKSDNSLVKNTTTTNNNNNSKKKQWNEFLTHYSNMLKQHVITQRPSSLQRAISLQLESAWQRHYRKVIVGGALVSTWLVWRSMRFTASAFVDISTSLATTGLFALAASVSMGGMWWMYRRHFVISPSAVYRAAMIRLNTHPGVLDIMGAPVVGSDVRATVLTGGGLKFKGFFFKLRSRRVQMIFPLHGSERRGLVSVEAKKRNGQLKTTMLAVDVPMPTALGGEQRVYVEGGPRNYSKSSVLDELRKPFLAAVQSEDAVDAEDEADDAADARKKEIEQVVSEH